MDNDLEHELFVMFAEPLGERGFVRDGNYFRRNTPSVMQAIHLQPTSWGGENYDPAMMITYPGLSTQRQNTQEDAHLRADLGDFYYTRDDLSNVVFWSCHLSRVRLVPDVLKNEILEAIKHAQAWFELYPDCKIAVERMRILKYAKSVYCRELFNDLGMAVPAPIRALKRKLFAMVSESLGEFGFKREGNYFRRDVGAVMQAIYLQPSRHGGEFFPELLVTFRDLSAIRKNTVDDEHLRTRLSEFYHSSGELGNVCEWSCTVAQIEADPDSFKVEFSAAIHAALAWFDLYPDYKTAAERMCLWRFAMSVYHYWLFHDMKIEVPIPIDE
ncbi:MAG: DUF4304 domain-containing protein [Azoarcus sp.]|nr:DUF4304 domain-containing protein [Azoarcus sp.]